LSHGEGDEMTSTERDAITLGSTRPAMSPDLIVQVPQGVPAKEMSYQEAIREALREEMRKAVETLQPGEYTIEPMDNAFYLIYLDIVTSARYILIKNNFFFKTLE
jgi:hypothetical protein